MDVKKRSQPILPRRAFVAAGLSAVLAGSAVSLGIVGGLSETERGVFQFSRGVSFANGSETQLNGLLSRALADERIHITVIGHSGTVGDPQANQKLSDERVDVVVAMIGKMGISPDRMTAQGVGGASALPKNEGESERAYQARLARVEVSLQMRR